MSRLIRHIIDNHQKALLTFSIDDLGKDLVDFELGVPEFCMFENMFSSKHQFYPGG